MAAKSRAKRSAPRRATPTSRQFRNDPTSRYAQQVVDGKIIAGEHHKAAAERHLRDLKDGPARGLHWRADKALHAINFFPAMLTITAGAKVGEPFKLLPWHLFTVGNLFGWHAASGRLRFRNAWEETGKGQAKSPLFAGIGLYMMGYRGIPRAQIYALAWDRDQANVLFKDAVAMCRAQIPDRDEGDSLVSMGEVILRGTHDNAWKIEHPATGSMFQSLANGPAISGPRPTLIAVDEVHEFKKVDPIETWQRAIAKMPGDALMLLGTNTPSTTQIVATQLSDYYQDVALGKVKDDEAFSLICRVDVADRDAVFDNEACWKKALPALGITFPIENIRGEVNRARTLLSTQFSVKRLYFGIPTGSASFWIAEEAWAAVQAPVDENEMIGLPCWLSLDLSQKNDLTALTATWWDEYGHLGKPGHLYSKTWYFTTKVGLDDRAKADHAPYLEWVHDKFLTAVPGPTIGKGWVAKQVQNICNLHDVKFLAFDPAGIADFIQACIDDHFAVWRWTGPDGDRGDGLMLVSHAQGKRIVFEDKQLCMPRSIERLEDRIKDETITIDASPVTYSCAANAIVDEDAQANRCFDKLRSRGRIDGLVTIAMGVGSATSDLATQGSGTLITIIG